MITPPGPLNLLIRIMNSKAFGVLQVTEMKCGGLRVGSQESDKSAHVHAMQIFKCCP